jgi:hypothetical protein
MEIETDVVVKEYTCRLVAQILNPRKKVKNRKNVRLLERAVMIVLEGLVASGAADHSYDEARQLDSFISTDRLVQNWSRMFPSDKLSIDRSKRHVFEMKGKRTKYFNDQWLAPNPNKLYPFYAIVA